MKNKYLTKFLCITLVAAMIAAVPFTTLAGEYEEWLVTARDWTDSLVAEDGASPDDWEEEETEEAQEISAEGQEQTSAEQTVPVEEPAVSPAAEEIPAQTTPSETPIPLPSEVPEITMSPTAGPVHTEIHQETAEDPKETEEGDVLFEEEGDPSSEGVLFPYMEAPKADPTSSPTATPTVTPTGTPTPTPTATPTPTPMVTTAARIGYTTSMVSNLHAGKEFYLTSLSTTYGLSFSENFPQIMDQIENEYLAKYHLKRSDSEGLLSRDWQDVIAIYLYEQSKLGRKVFNLGSSDKAELARIFEYLNPILQTRPDAGDDASKWDYSKEHYYDPAQEVKNQKKNKNNTTGSETDLFSDSEEETEEDLAEKSTQNLATDAVWWQVPTEDTDGVVVLESAVDPSLYMENPVEAVQTVNLSGLFDSGSSESGRIAQFGNKPVAYANRHINYYIRDNNISRSDRSVLKKYTETDCKLLCATVTAAKGFVRQSVGDNVSEDRVDVISAAYSLVGKVGYFWGGKSTYLGEDPAWGSVGTVTASGSNSTGTLRAYGLDCSGFVTWAVINGYEDKAMQSAIGDGTSEQWEHAKVVSEADAQPGDLVFQRGPEAGSDNHVGILVGKTDSGDWIAVHCSSSQNGVTVGEAYSASFRYIREPSFYPEKVEPTNIVLEENIDDILVDADIPGGASASENANFSLFEDDFLDVVVVDGTDSTGTQSTDTAASNTELFEPYDPTVDTDGLVVLDETGPVQPVIVDVPENTENSGAPEDVQPEEPIGPQEVIVLNPEEETLPADNAQTEEPVIVIYPEEAGPQPEITHEAESPEEAGPQPEIGHETEIPQTTEDRPAEEPIITVDNEPIQVIDVDQTMEESEYENPIQGPAVQITDTRNPDETLPEIETIDVDEALAVQEDAEPAAQELFTEETAVSEEEEQTVIDVIDVDAAIASGEETDPEEDSLDEESVPEEVMELVVLEGLDWDDFESETAGEEQTITEIGQKAHAEADSSVPSEEMQGPVYHPETVQPMNAEPEVIVIDPDLFGDSTPTPAVPVLEIVPNPEMTDDSLQSGLFEIFPASENPQGSNPVMEVTGGNAAPGEEMVVIEPSSDVFSSGDLFSSQEAGAPVSIAPGETIVEQEIIQVFEATPSVTPTGTPVPKSFFSILAGLFQ